MKISVIIRQIYLQCVCCESRMVVEPKPVDSKAVNV